MARPRKPNPWPVPVARKRTTAVTVELEADDRARLDAIAAALAARDGSIPSVVRALRWAIRELGLRLTIARTQEQTGHAGEGVPVLVAAPPEP